MNLFQIPFQSVLFCIGFVRIWIFAAGRKEISLKRETKMWIGLELGPFVSWQFYTSFKATCWWLILQSMEIEIGQKSLTGEKKASVKSGHLCLETAVGHGGWDLSPALENWHAEGEENFLLCEEYQVSKLFEIFHNTWDVTINMKLSSEVFSHETWALCLWPGSCRDVDVVSGWRLEGMSPESGKDADIDWWPDPAPCTARGANRNWHNGTKKPK